MLEESCERINSPACSAPLVSPSLTGSENLGPLAYEMKFLVPEGTASRIQHWARQHLGIDPHADPHRNDGYETTTLYLDTPAFDVYHRTVGFRRRKYRVRRYNNASTLFMECKTRRGDEVAKHRCSLPLEDVARFGTSETDPAWTAVEYHRALLERALRPSCRMTYHRSAFLGKDRSGSLRLTLDREIRGTLSDEWNTTPLATGTRILENEVICELKFRDSLPTLFKNFVAEFGLETSAVSKYRRLLSALGFVPPGESSNV